MDQVAPLREVDDHPSIMGHWAVVLEPAIETVAFFAPVCVSVQGGLMLGLIIRAFGLVTIMWLIERARCGRARAAAGVATYCQSSLWRYSGVERSLLTPNQLFLAGTVKDKLSLLKLIELITNNIYLLRGSSLSLAEMTTNCVRSGWYGRLLSLFKVLNLNYRHYVKLN